MQFIMSGSILFLPPYTHGEKKYIWTELELNPGPLALHNHGPSGWYQVSYDPITLHFLLFYDKELIVITRYIFRSNHWVFCHHPSHLPPIQTHRRRWPPRDVVRQLCQLGQWGLSEHTGQQTAFLQPEGDNPLASDSFHSIWFWTMIRFSLTNTQVLLNSRKSNEEVGS